MISNDNDCIHCIHYNVCKYKETRKLITGSTPNRDISAFDITIKCVHYKSIGDKKND